MVRVFERERERFLQRRLSGFREKQNVPVFSNVACFFHCVVHYSSVVINHFFVKVYEARGALSPDFRRLFKGVLFNGLRNCAYS